MKWKDCVWWHLGFKIPIEDHGIVNFDIVIPDVLYASGQPITKESWEYIQSLGIESVFKLDYESEGSDAGAVQLGLDVHDRSMQPKDFWESLEKPNLNLIYSTVDLLYYTIQILKKKSLVHCLHGQDRTWLIVGIYLVKYCNMSCDDAYDTMCEHGFHFTLLDLQECWEEFCKSRCNLDTKS